MPLPLLIPIGIGIASVVTGGGLALGAHGKIKKAKAEYQAAYDNYKAKHQHYKSYHAGTERHFQRLGQTRVLGMEAVREAIDFIRRAKLVNPNIISNDEVNLEDLERLDQIYEDILKELAGAVGSVGLGGIFAAPALIAFGVFRQVKADKVQKEVAEKIQRLRVEEAKLDREQAKLQAARQRSDELTTTIRKLMERLRAALQNADSGMPEDVYRIVQIAKALRAAIDEPVTPPDTNNARR